MNPIILLTLSLLPLASAEPPAQTQYFQGEHESAQLSVQERIGTVSVTFSKSTTLPPSIELTWMDSERRSRTIELRALEASETKSPVFRGTLPSALTRPGAAMGSFVGVEIKIPLGRGHARLLRPLPN